MVKIGQGKLSFSDFERVLYLGEKIELADTALAKVEKNYSFLHAWAENKIIYGINTGFGPMAQYKISEADQHQLQYNLIRSHSSGAGAPMAEDLSRATMLARLNSLMQGYSGIHPSAVELLTKLLNEKISACIFERGGVGASGDLVQLAHLALNLIGEGEVLVDGQLRPAGELFASRGIEPPDLPAGRPVAHEWNVGHDWCGYGEHYSRALPHRMFCSHVSDHQRADEVI
jgi:histidine ammonia-lyase